MKKYNGVIVPVITPFTQDLKIDHLHLEKILKRLIKHNCHPFVMGTTGEGLSISVENKLDLIKTFVKAKNESTVFYASVSDVCNTNMITLSKRYAELGVDVVVVHLPPQYPLSPLAMIKWFETLADQSPCPLMLYNIPSTTGMSIPLDVVEQLSRHENIVGLKDSERDKDRLKEATSRWKDRPDFSYFIGWAAQSLAALKLGSDGIVPSSGNLFPVVYKKLLKAVKEREDSTGEEMQKISDELGALYQKDRLLPDSLSALKVIMQIIELSGPYVLPPLYRLDKEEENKVVRQFNEYYSNHKKQLDV